MRVAARIGRDDRAVGAELPRELRSEHGGPLLVLRALVVAAAGDHAGEAKPLAVGGEQLAHERRVLEVSRSGCADPAQWYSPQVSAPSITSSGFSGDGWKPSSVVP